MHAFISEIKKVEIDKLNKLFAFLNLHTVYNIYYKISYTYLITNKVYIYNNLFSLHRLQMCIINKST